MIMVNKTTHGHNSLKNKGTISKWRIKVTWMNHLPDINGAREGLQNWLENQIP